MSVDAIGNFLTVIRNGLLVSKRFVIVPHSVVKSRIAEILLQEGFIRDFQVIEDETGKRSLKIYLKYVDGESVIHEITRVSTPGKRTYRGARSLGHVIGNLGISILSTNKGVLTDKRARELSVGGEVICTVW
jgi:small subunit ribosomal protein S8